MLIRISTTQNRTGQTASLQSQATRCSLTLFPSTSTNKAEREQRRCLKCTSIVQSDDLFRDSSSQIFSFIFVNVPCCPRTLCPLSVSLSSKTVQHSVETSSSTELLPLFSLCARSRTEHSPRQRLLYIKNVGRDDDRKVKSNTRGILRAGTRTKTDERRKKKRKRTRTREKKKGTRTKKRCRHSCFPIV